MNKVAVALKVMLLSLVIIFVLSGCGSNSRVQTNDLPSDSATNAVSESVSAPGATSNQEAGGKAEKNEQDSKLLLVSEKFGFTMEAPAFWKGKVKISEDNDSFTVRHITKSAKAPVQDPVIINVIQYGSEAKWEQDAKKENEPFPYQKLGVINGMVFASVFTFDFPYDDSSPADQKEYAEIMDSVDGVLKTFKPLNKQDNRVKTGTEQSGNRYFVAGIDDPAALRTTFSHYRH